MNDPSDIEDDPYEAEMKEDLERYFRLIIASRAAWFNFWLLGVMTMVGGIAVWAFSGETWGVGVCGVMFLILFARTARVIGRFDGELAFLHRKWIRRGRFFITDGDSAAVLPHEAD